MAKAKASNVTLNKEAPFICPECREAGKGKEAEFQTYHKRYWHRRKAHNIVPKPAHPASKSIVKVQANVPVRHQNGASELVIERAQADAENLINFIAGSCLEQIRTNAAEFGIPQAVIASGVTRLLQAHTSRSLRGLSHRMSGLRDQAA